MFRYDIVRFTADLSIKPMKILLAFFLIIAVAVIADTYINKQNQITSNSITAALSTPTNVQNQIPTDTPLPTPTPTPPAFPADITAAKTYQYIAESNGTFNVVFSFNNPYGRSISIGIDSTQFANPGPAIDTTGNSWTFTNVPALSTQYVNMKAMVDGAWSSIVSWTLQIPSWTAPVAPRYYPYPVYYPQNTYTHCSSDYVGGMNCYSY